VPGGGVCGVFPYRVTDVSKNDRDEVYTELVSNFYSASTKYNANMCTGNNNSAGWHVPLAADFNLQEYHTCAMITGPAGTTWHIDSNQMLSESGAPGGPKHFYLNFWAPASNGWTWAYSSDINPSSTAGTE
jgi:hypothetical protein